MYKYLVRLLSEKVFYFNYLFLSSASEDVNQVFKFTTWNSFGTSQPGLALKKVLRDATRSTTEDLPQSFYEDS